MKKIVLILITSLYFTTAYSQFIDSSNFYWNWANSSQNIGSINDNYATSIAVDNVNNVIITGTLLNYSVVLGTNNLQIFNADSSGLMSDFFIAKYNQNGNVIWAKNASCNGSTISNKVMVDSSGNIYATGFLYSDSNQSISFDGVSTYTYPYNLSGHSFIVKYSPEGITQWAIIINNYNTGRDSISCLKWDQPANKLIIGGTFTGDSIKIGNYLLSKPHDNYCSLFIAKVSPLGIVEWGNNTKGNTQRGIINDITADNTGAIYYAATYTGRYISFAGDSIVNSSQNDYNTYADGFFVKFNTNGVLQWIRNGYCSLSDGISTISYNKKSNMLIIGGYNDTLIVFNNTLLNGRDYYAYFDLQGNFIKAVSYPTKINKIVCAENSPDFTIGGVYNTDSLILGSVILHKYGNNGTLNTNIYIANYDTSGVVKRGIAAGGYSSSYLSDIYEKDSGQFYLCGSFNDSIMFFDTIQLANNGSSFFIAKLDTGNTILPPVEIKYNIGGTVFADFLTVDHAITYLYDSTFNLVDSCSVDTLGFYNYYQKPKGNYVIKTLLSSNSIYINQYAPTYFTGSLFWDNADTIKLTTNKWGQDIHLNAIATLTTGTGSIQGSVSGNSIGLLPNIEVLLLDTANHPLEFKLTDANGVFMFDNLAFGKYKIYPEVAGKTTTPDIIILNTSNPTVNNINYIVTSTTVSLLIEDIEELKAMIFTIYPNPTKDNLTIETNTNIEQRIEIINLIGQTVYFNIINKKATINTSAFTKGFYIIKLHTDKETIFRKFVKE